MFDTILHPKHDAINVLKADHDKVKELFSEFRDKSRHRAKRDIIAEAVKELRIHALIEEEIFYPTVRPRLAKAMMNEANEEHHVAKVLIAELLAMDGTEEHYDAKFTVLSENIEHHIKEEERDMFPDVRALDLDLTRLGEKMLARKSYLLENGIPASAEELRIAAVGPDRMDSPAANVEKFKTKADRMKQAALNTPPTIAKTAAKKKLASKKE